MVTTRPPKTIVKPTALGPVANTDTKLLIYGLFQKGRVLAQDGKVNEHNGLVPRDHWIEEWERQSVIDYFDCHPLDGYRRLTFMELRGRAFIAWHEVTCA